MTKLKLVSQEGDIIEVDKEVAAQLSLIKDLVEDTNADETIPIPNIKTQVLRKVLEYCEKHKAENPSKGEKSLEGSDLAEFDWKYIDIENQEEIFDIIEAANYLDVKPLLELSQAKVASLMKGKSPEEIRKVFNIKSDYTPEEEAQMKPENNWS